MQGRHATLTSVTCKYVTLLVFNWPLFAIYFRINLTASYCQYPVRQ